MKPQKHEVDRLRYNVLSETLSDIQFDSIKDKFIERRFKAGEIILEDEQEGEDLYLLVDGRVKITKNLKDGRETRLALLHSGDFFGELELVDGRPRGARVIALEDCLTYAFNRSHFEKLLHESHPFMFRLLQVISIRLRSMNNHFVREIDRTRQHNAREIEKLNRVIEAAKNLNSTLDLDKLLKVILDNALWIVDGDRGTVYLIDEEKEELWSRVLTADELFEIRLPMGKGIAGYVAATGDTLNIPDAYFDPRFDPEFDRRTGYKTESILCMPMRNKERKIIGVFQLLNKHAGTFTEEDETILDALSVHAAIAVENARLYEHERQMVAMEKDLLAAREVQMTLIPKTIPPIRGYDVAASTLPAREVGGDLYDFIPIDDTKMAFCLGDVSGKGLAASLLMANLQATLRNQAQFTASPAECVRRSSKFLFQNTSAEKFVTLFYAVIDTRTNSLNYCNAGHERPMLFSGTRMPGRLDAGGVVLGILEDFPFQEDTVQLKPGDVLVIFTDGISEAMNEAEEQFGEQRLEAAIRKYRDRPAAELKDQIIAAVRAHAGNVSQMDDITLMVIKRATA
jgi:sigma-B regulation protein RsbU (phosphoserine phosphatase)